MDRRWRVWFHIHREKPLSGDVKYFRDFNRLNEGTKTAAELYQRMLQLYPDGVNPGSLWGAAHAAKR